MTNIQLPTFGIFQASIYPTSIVNNAEVHYIYVPGVGLDTITDGAVSNYATTTLSVASLSTSKTVDKSYTFLGDVLTYTIPITNTGTTIARNIVFSDTIPQELSIVPNSFTQDGVVISGSPNPPGVSLKDIDIDITSTITFQATVIKVPISKIIQNSANINYSYIVDPSTTPIYQINTATNTNIVTSTVSAAELSNIRKYVDKSSATVNTTLTYTISFTNTGNLTANNVMLVDTIPVGTNFVSGSVYVNGVNNPTANPAPPGINIGSLGVNQGVTVTFNVVISNKPPYPSLLTNVAQTTYDYSPDIQVTKYTQDTSNLVTTNLSAAVLEAKKLVDKTNANVGDILTYTIQLTNIGTTITNSVYFSDKISSSLTVLPKSFEQDGVPLAGSLVPPGLPLANIPPKSTSIITFNARVTKAPVSGEIENFALITNTYSVDPTTEVTTTTVTNTISTSINMANLSSINKSVDKDIAKINDILTYTISISNTGNISANNVLLKDSLSEGAEFVEGSVTINGLSTPNANPISPGINLGEIKPNETIIITFKALVVPVLPSPCEISNIAKVNYEFKSGTNTVSASSTSNSTSTELASPQVRRRR